MTVTTTTLTRAAGVSAVAAACCSSRCRSTTRTWTPPSRRTTEFAVRQTMKIVVRRPLAGRHHRHVPAPGDADRRARPARIPASRCGVPRDDRVEMMGLVVLPVLAHSVLDYVTDVLAVATDGTATGDIGLFTTLNTGVGLALVAAACCSASPCSAPAFSTGGRPPCSPSASSPPSPSRSCRRSTASLRHPDRHRHRGPGNRPPGRAAHPRPDARRTPSTPTGSTRQASSDQGDPSPHPPGRSPRPGGCRRIRYRRVQHPRQGSPQQTVVVLGRRVPRLRRRGRVHQSHGAGHRRGGPARAPHPGCGTSVSADLPFAG